MTVPFCKSGKNYKYNKNNNNNKNLCLQRSIQLTKQTKSVVTNQKVRKPAVKLLYVQLT